MAVEPPETGGETVQVLEQICYELICLPLEQTQPDHYAHVGSRTIAALAVTARLFLEPALDVLWRAIPDIAVLFFALDKEIYSQRRVARRGHSESQLERFFAYAQRVRAINFDAHVSTCTRWISAVPEAYDKLAAILGSRALLPNLEIINFKHTELTSQEVFRTFHILFGPKLGVVRILGGRAYDDPYNIRRSKPITAKDDEAFAQMLKKLTDLKPQLQALIIERRPCSTAMTASLQGAVCALNHLVSLKLSYCNFCVTPASFKHLAGLPTLRELDCEVNDSEDWANGLASLARIDDAQHKLFPVLCELLLKASTLALPAGLLRHVGSPYLTELTIIAAGAVPRPEVDLLLKTVAGLRGAKTITEFRVIAHRVEPSAFTVGAAPPDPAPARLRPIGNTTLEPLLALSAVMDLALEILCPFDINDMLLSRFGAVWGPRLRFLKLGLDAQAGFSSWPLLTEGDFLEGGAPWDGAGEKRRILRHNRVGGGLEDCADVWHKPRVTLFGLLMLARNCPEEAVFQFELNANLRAVSPALLEALPKWACSAYVPPVISGLYVGLSPIEDPYAVASFLSCFVSGIDCLRSGWLEMMDHNDIRNDNGVDEDEDGDRDDLEWSSVARIYHKRWRMVQRLIPLFAEGTCLSFIDEANTITSTITGAT
ncbi:uncharacterized protein TRAVEDRAFT_19406 [Trametes versicolor FP-101664 SS1]|uniref:uncharacterized protein n=1 Tax=Trametes versicolor (strain FP-101664) TaxID=717944 RepID=UPI00046238FA|nr:uncharacterized protein TRAVEDRAFT_19406 [Trametes versicolor FP-101664 SS1]EIW60850.1 hypothetical protein TRAVEDRAFT_19406 [Trametes versicolor FP-101664 SS1]